MQALNQQFARSLRNRLEASRMHAGSSIEEVIARFLDESVELAERRKYAYRLARDASPDALAALRKVLESASPEHKAFLAQLIGSSGNPAVKPVLLPLLDDSNPRVVMGAIRGLATIGGEEITALLAGILGDDKRAESIRVAAAGGLGTIHTVAAREALAAAFAQEPSDELATQILRCLGQFPFPTVAETFEEYLTAAETPSTMRVVAAEALAFSSREAVPLLLGLAREDADAEVRASAAWAISTYNEVSDLGTTLAELTERETDVDVRRRLYEALLPQAEIPVERLLPLIRSETNIAARVAGLNAVGRAAAQQPSSDVALTFDREMVPELARIATSPNSLNIQMRAVFALRRAQTTTAKAALTQIAGSARPQVATAARNGLRATSS